MSFKNHDQTIDKAFSTLGYTAITLPAVPVNKVIQERYNANQPITITKSMMWDMELRKVAAPEKYLPQVVKPGSAEIFPSKWDGVKEYFTRVSQQRCWKKPDVFTTVIERICLDHEKKRAIAIGDYEFTAPDGWKFVSGVDQPIFHAEHAIIGDHETEPKNFWRIVHLTDGVDEGLKEFFALRIVSAFLPIYAEVYITEDLKAGLTKKDS